MYTLLYSYDALQKLKKLEKETPRRIINTLERIRIRPAPHVQRLVGCPYFKLRVGDYRVILDITGRTLLILVMDVGDRKNVYD